MFHKKSASTNISVDPSEKSPAKSKKKFYKKWWFWLIVLIFIGAMASPSKDTQTDATSKPNTDETGETVSQVSEPESENPPDIEFANDSERLIWQIIKDNNGELASISSTETSDGVIMTGAVKCENDESVVNAILNAVAESVKSSEANESAVLIFADINDQTETALVSGAVETDGTVSVVELSNAYNSAHNIWIREQFSAWDGSHRELTKLIKAQLNDEKSYDHISTTYREITDEDAKAEVNQVLANAGYSQRVEVNDLFIQTEFSAKNAFNATIKNTAFGIASYANNTITLIDIG